MSRFVLSATHRNMLPPSCDIHNGHLDCDMTITVTEFKARCLEILRDVEESGEPVTLVRRKKVVAVIYPAHIGNAEVKPWHRLRGMATLHAAPGESVLRDEDFEALR